MNRVVRKIVNDCCSCNTCREYKDCVYGKGSNCLCTELIECGAEGIGDGIRATIEYLSKLPWNEAIEVICKYNEDCNERH